MTRSRRRLAAATTIAVPAALLALIIVLWAIAPAAEAPESGDDDPLPLPTASGPAVDTAYFDDVYLAGNAYVRGVNVYSLVFAGRGADPADIGEPAESYRFLADRGFDFVRLAVPWQRLQEIPEGGAALDGLAQPIDTAYLDAVAAQVARASEAGLRTVIDLHNGCTYPWGAGEYVDGSVRCGDGITEDHVRYIWGALAERFRDDPGVLAYDIFNEPRWSVGAAAYLRYSQVAVDAIRATGDGHAIWVEGILSDTRGRLAALAPHGPWIVDPLGRTMYSEHFYADENGAAFSDVAAPRVVLDRLRTFAEWCARWGVRCSVGEVGWPSGGPGGVQTRESAQEWNVLFDEFYTVADEYGLDVAYFGASGSRQVGTLLAYVASVPGIPSRSGIDTALSQAEVVERHLSRPAAG